MMFFDSLRAPAHNARPNLAGRPCQVILGLLLALAFVPAGAQTMIEEVEVPKPVVLESGVPIPNLEDAAKRAITIDSADESGQRNYEGTAEYKLGTKTVREYRYGKSLHYVEVIDESGATYIVQQDQPFKSDERKPRSGIRISNW